MWIKCVLVTDWQPRWPVHNSYLSLSLNLQYQTSIHINCIALQPTGKNYIKNLIFIYLFIYIKKYTFCFFLVHNHLEFFTFLLSLVHEVRDVCPSNMKSIELLGFDSFIGFLVGFVLHACIVYINSFLLVGLRYIVW